MSSLTRITLASALTLALLAGGAQAADDTLEWLTTWPQAQAAARTSGKFILVYIYEPRQPACVEMDKTFTDETVVKALNKFVTLALNGSAGANRDFCERFKVGLRAKTDTELKVEFAAIPTYLFLDVDGHEYYRTFGFRPVPLFVELLQNAERLTRDLPAIAQRPNDARLNADLGQVYLDLERIEEARPYLQNAIRLDPQNATGARAEAELGLILLGIPENPDLAFRQLVAYQFNHPETRRGLEIRYYMAVAELANNHLDKAERILLDFQAIPRFLPQEQQAEGVNYGYLVEERGQQVALVMADSLEQAKAAAQKAGKNPAACTFTRKALNPDYRNHWTELADLLYQQLQDMKGTKPANNR